MGDTGGKACGLVLQIPQQGSHLLSRAGKATHRGLCCVERNYYRAILSNKNRQSTVIWLWFNNAFKRGSKWPIKHVTPSLLWDSPGSPSELVPFKYRSHPREGLETSKCESLLPSTELQPGKLLITAPRPLTLLASLSSPLPSFCSFPMPSYLLNNESWSITQVCLSLKPPAREAECHPYLWALNGFYQSEVTLNHTQAVINTNDST